jgi:cytochrome c oxidase cbb3-type subunit IV
MTLFDLLPHVQGVLLVLTVVIFLGIAWWAYSPKNRKQMDDDAQIPMRDDR